MHGPVTHEYAAYLNVSIARRSTCLFRLTKLLCNPLASKVLLRVCSHDHFYRMLVMSQLQSVQGNNIRALHVRDF